MVEGVEEILGKSMGLAIRRVIKTTLWTEDRNVRAVHEIISRKRSMRA